MPQQSKGLLYRMCHNPNTEEIKENDINYAKYAKKYYDNPLCFDEIEFNNDMKRFKYLKRLFNKYAESGELKERLVLNHLIVLHNVFGPEIVAKLLFYKLGDYAHILKPFLTLLSSMPETIHGIDGKIICNDDIFVDRDVVEKIENTVGLCQTL